MSLYNNPHYKSFFNSQYSNNNSSHSHSIHNAYSKTTENDSEDEDPTELNIDNYFDEYGNGNSSNSEIDYTNYTITSDNYTNANTTRNRTRTVETTTLNPKIYDDNFTRYDFLLPIIGIWFCIGILLFLLFLWFARCLMMSNRKKRELFLLKHEKYKEMIEQNKMKMKEKENENEHDLSLCQQSIDNSQTISSQESTGSVFTLVETVSTKKNSQDEMSNSEAEMIKFSSPSHRKNPTPVPFSVPGPSRCRDWSQNQNQSESPGSSSYSQVLKFYTMDWKVEQYELQRGSK